MNKPITAKKFASDLLGLVQISIDEAVLAEREACAKVADEWSKRQDDVGGYIARNIRARGEQA
jgi:hypothetical protein